MTLSSYSIRSRISCDGLAPKRNLTPSATSLRSHDDWVSPSGTGNRGIRSTCLNTSS